MKHWWNLLHGINIEETTDLVSKRIRRYNYIKWALLTFVTLVAVTAITLTITAQVSQNSKFQCVATWANSYADRSDKVLNASNARNDAIDALIRTIPLRNEAAFEAALEHYQQVSNTYTQVQHDNPLPPAPKFNC